MRMISQYPQLTFKNRVPIVNGGGGLHAGRDVYEPESAQRTWEHFGRNTAKPKKCTNRKVTIYWKAEIQTLLPTFYIFNPSRIF